MPGFAQHCAQGDGPRLDTSSQAAGKKFFSFWAYLEVAVLGGGQLRERQAHHGPQLLQLQIPASVHVERVEQLRERMPALAHVHVQRLHEHRAWVSVPFGVEVRAKVGLGLGLR